METEIFLSLLNGFMQESKKFPLDNETLLLSRGLLDQTRLDTRKKERGSGPFLPDPDNRQMDVGIYGDCFRYKCKRICTDVYNTTMT